MSETRAKAWVGYIDPDDDGEDWYVSDTQVDIYTHPVVVTPLLDGDPKPGEVWVCYGYDVTVLTAPFYRSFLNDWAVVVEKQTTYDAVIQVPLTDLKPKPTKKRFVLTDAILAAIGDRYIIEAESVDDALEQLRPIIEEVE